MDDAPQPEEIKLDAEAPEQGAIRGAFVARATYIETTGGGSLEIVAATAAMRGAYLGRLVERSAGGVVGDEAGDTFLRSIYAARSAPAAAPARKALVRPAKAAAKKRAAPSRPSPVRRCCTFCATTWS